MSPKSELARQSIGEKKRVVGGKEVCKLNEMRCLDYTYLAKHGIIHKQPFQYPNEVTWQNEHGIIDMVMVTCTYNQSIDKRDLELQYIVVGLCGNIEYRYQRIELIEVPSNLGVGKLTYFVCPISGRKCRKLYRPNNGNRWQSRESFKERVYYPLQLCSKMQSYDAKYWAYDYWIAKYNDQKIKTKHNLKFTKKFKRLSALGAKQALMGDLRLSPLAMPLHLRRLFPEALVAALFTSHGKACQDIEMPVEELQDRNELK